MEPIQNAIGPIGHFKAAFSVIRRERGEHVLIPFDLLKAGLYIQRCQNWKILLFNGKEEMMAISSKEVIQNAEILFSVLQAVAERCGDHQSIPPYTQYTEFHRSIDWTIIITHYFI